MVEATQTGEVPPMAYLPPTINGKPTRIDERVAKRGIPTVRDNIVRIQREADPLSFLIAVSNGQLFPVHIVQPNGEIATVYEMPTLNQRIRAAQYLAEKMMPKMGVIKVVDDRPPGAPVPAGAPMTFAQAVEKAASNMAEGRPLLENHATIEAQADDE